MAVGIYTSDLTTLIPDDVGSTNNWAALGGGASGLNIETDYFIQGSNCCSKNAFANATKGMVEDTTNTLLTTGDLSAVYTWITHTTPGSLDTKANGGLRIALGSASNQYNEYYYAGSDTIDYGAPWICAVVDPENSTANTGTVAHTAMDTYGGLAKLVGGPTKGAPLGIDAIRQGRSYTVTEGDSGTPATFTGASTENDLLANRYGQFQGVPGISGAYTMQCHFSIGSASTAAYFSDENFNISLNDLEFVDPDFQLFEVVNAGTTCIWKNGTISAVGSNAKGNFLATSSLLVEHTGMNFNDMGTFTYDANSTVDGTKFSRCTSVTQGSGTFTGCTFDSLTATSGFIVDNLGIVTASTFVSDGTGHAVDLGTVSGTASISWDNQDTGYAGVDGSTGNETILVSVDSGVTLTINVEAGASTPTVNNVGLGTVNVVAGLVTLTINISPTPSDYEYRIYTVTALGSLVGAVEVQGSESESSPSQSYAYTFSAGTFIGVQILDHTDTYLESINYYELSSSSVSQNITLKEDTND